MERKEATLLQQYAGYVAVIKINLKKAMLHILPLHAAGCNNLPVSAVENKKKVEVNRSG